MMKKIFALVLLLVLGKMSYAQYPITQTLGSDSTIVISKGALQSRLINVTYTDTTAANLQRIRQYPGAQIATTTGGLNLWVRNATATAWNPIATGLGNNIYTIDGTLTGNRTLSGGGNSLTFTGLSQFLLSVGNQTFTVKSDSATLTKRLSYTTNLGSTFKMYSLVDKNYVDSSITASPAGTVTQVNTNNGSGITGGPITSTGTLAIDTLLISTRAWRQKGVDSLQANINFKLNIVDTTGMLANYVNSVGYGLGKTSQTVYVDSASLSNYYLRRKDSLTATNPLGYVTKKVLADTAAAIRSSDLGGTVTSVATNNGTGITGGTITTSGTLAIDTTIISTRAWRQKGVDSLQANINLKLNISDTASMLNPYLRKVDTASLSNRINQKLNISDTASMLSPYLRSNTAAATYVPQTRTLTINGTTQDLSANRTYNVGTVTSVATNYGLTGGTITTSGTLSVDSATLSNYYLRRKDSLTTTNPLGYVTKKVLADTAAAIRGADAGGTVTSVATNNGTGITGGTITTTGTLAIDTLLISTRAWRQKGIDSVANLPRVTSVGLTMPAAFNVANSPVTGSGTLAVTAAGNATQYIRGDGVLALFPGGGGGGGGGKIYYLNGGVNLGTYAGITMYELGDTAVIGSAANFTRATTGNIANFITDVNKPGLLQIPSGVWTVDAYLSETGGGSNHAELYAILEIWNGTTLSTVATSPALQITEGTFPTAYSFDISVPTTNISVTDRIVIQFYIQNTNGKTVTLYTQNGYVGEVHTTFTTGIGSLNGLTAPSQFFATGTSGTDFNISSVTETHTFNLPVASATNTGKLSSTDWSTFNNKVGGSLVNGYITKATGTNTIDTSQLFQSNGLIGIGTTSPTQKLQVSGNAYVNGQLFAGDTALSVYQVEGILTTPYVLGRKAVNNTLSTEARPTGIQGHVVGRGSIANRLQGGTFYATTDSASTANSTGSLRGATAWSSHNGSGSLTTAWGGYNIVQNKTTGTITNAYGSVSGVENRGATSTINKLHGTTTEIWNNYGGTIDTAFGQVISIYNNNAASNIGAVYGLSIGKGLISASGGTHYWRNSGTIGTSYGLYLDSSIDVGTTKYALFSNSNSNSYFRAKLGVGTTSPDSAFQVATGAYFQRGIRASGLPQAPGTKALRIDASGTISYADTLIDAGGTVTSVATNNGTGITGGTITTTGTLAIDTLLISTRAWRQKGIDSVQANLTAGLATKLNISDTASMLSPYLRSNVAAATYVPLTRTITINGTSQDLSANRTYNVGTVTSVGATAGTGISVSGSPITTSGSLTITNTAPDQTVVLNNGTGISVTGTYPNFTITNTSPSSGGTVTSVATNTGTGITGGTITSSGTIAADTLLLSTRAWRQKGVDSVASLINTRISGTTNYIPKFTSSSAIGNSQLVENGSTFYYDNGLGRYAIVNASAENTVSSYTTNANAYNDFVTRAATHQWRIANSEVMRLTSGGSLGIGISSPAYTLDVNGTGGFADNVIAQKGQNTTTKFEAKNTTVGTSSDAAFIATSDASAGATVFGKKSSGVTTYKILTPSVAYWYNGTAGDIAIINDFGSGAIKMSAGGSSTAQLTLNASGNLGLGTSSPSFKLDVNSGASNAYARIQTTGSVNWATLLLQNGDGTWYNTNNSDGNFNIGTGADPSDNIKLTLTASGNLGLGVTPSAWSVGKAFELGSLGNSLWGVGGGDIILGSNFYYNADFKYASSNYATAYRQQDGVHKWLISSSGTANATISFTQAMTLFSTGNLAVGGTSDAGYKLYVSGSSGIVVADGAISNYYNSTSSSNILIPYLNATYGMYLQARNAAGSANNKMSIQASSLMLNPDGGNVAIGTTSPTAGYLLDVRGRGRFAPTSTNYIADFVSPESNGSSLLVYADNASVALVQGGTSAVPMAFYTGGSERMRLDASGNLGLGVSPSAWSVLRGLQNGRANLVGYVSNAEGAWLTNNAFYNGTSWTYQTSAQATMYQQLSGVQSWHIAGSGTAGNPISFTQTMTLDASGNLLVGGTSDALTDVNRKVISLNGTSDAIISLRYGGSLNGFIWGNGSTAFQIASNNLPIVFSNGNAGGTERMRLDVSGNLGLGTSSPYTASNYIFATTNGTNGSGYVTRVNGTTSILVYSNSSASTISEQRALPIVFETSGLERMRLDASGNLGLGVSPSAWNSGAKVLQISSTSSFYGTSNATLIGQNTFNNTSGNNIYLTTAAASLYQQFGGAHSWFTAASGTAGNAISFTQAMTLDASGRLGIGTTSPGYTLQVKNSDASVTVSSSDNTAEMRINAQSGLAILETITNTDLRIRTNSTERMRITSGGNLLVGGTSDNGNRLQVTGSITTSGTSTGAYVGLTIGNTSTGAAQLKLNNSAQTWLVNTRTDNHYSVYNETSGTTPFLITTSGNVGIGTTSPAYKLDINGGFADGTNNYIATFHSSTGSTGDAYIGIGAYRSDALGSGRNAYINAVAPSGGSGNLLLQTSGGSVGIGTTSPNYKLDVSGIINASSDIYTATRLATDLINGYTGGGTPLTIQTGGAQSIIFGTNATERMRITSGGNVGIGTTSPGEKLEIYGSAAATSNFTALKLTNGSDGGLKILFSNSVSSELASIVAGVTSAGVGTDDGTLIFSTATNAVSTERMRITSGGELLINTTSDAGDYKLQVAGNVYAGGNFVSQGTGTSQFIMNANSGTYSASINTGGTGNGLGYTTGQLYFGVDNNVIAFANKSSLGESMRITSSGELLINTTSDAGDYKLQVNGSVYINKDDVGLTLNRSAVTAYNGLEYRTNGSSQWFVGMRENLSSNNYIIYNYNGTDAVTVDKSTSAVTLASSIKTAAPSGGTAQPWKLGSAGVTLGGSNLSGVEVEINGTTYYLVTGYLPEPEPDPAAAPTSGPSGSYKTYNKPTPVKSAQDAKIQKLEKEVEELKEMIKALMPQVKK